jgi:hypothetical protein
LWGESDAYTYGDASGKRNTHGHGHRNSDGNGNADGYFNALTSAHADATASPDATATPINRLYRLVQELASHSRVPAKRGGIPSQRRAAGKPDKLLRAFPAERRIAKVERLSQDVDTGSCRTASPAQLATIKSMRALPFRVR